MTCIISPLFKDKDGYPRIKFGGRKMSAQRLIWYMMYGAIPAGQMICHTCDNPSCVNPDHLYLGTHADNMKDKVDRKRVAGSRHPRSKLTDHDVASIKTRFNEAGLTQQQLADEFGVSQSTISMIVNDKRRN